ncbi:MAG: TolB family protein, partial [Halobacteriota archaeon]
MAAEQLPLEEIARLPEVYHPSASPGGDAIAYYYDGSGRNELYVDRLDGDGPRRLSDGELPRSARWGPRWRGDGEAILFHRDDDGDEQNDIWEIDLAENARPLVEPE